MAITENQKQFLITEYVQLKSEIMLCIQGIENTERYALVFSGAIWAWLATQKWNFAFFIVLFIPALLTKLLEIKRRSLAKSINQIATYIRKIEDAIGVSNEKAGKLGWEHREQEDDKTHTFRDWKKIYWKLLFWGNVIIGLIYFITSLVVEYKLIHF
ncbi:MAG: hypothetical protein ABI904_22350 [Chloroflexota bacterium]